MLTLNDVLNKAKAYDLGPIILVNGHIIDEKDDKFIHRYSLIRTSITENKWKISDGSSVYSKSQKDFEGEPMPSSRTQEFLEDTRFDSIESAVHAMNEYRARMTEFYLSKGLTLWKETV